jgi:hypothetical protein
VRGTNRTEPLASSTGCDDAGEIEVAGTLDADDTADSLPMVAHADAMTDPAAIKSAVWTVRIGRVLGGDIGAS